MNVFNVCAKTLALVVGIVATFSTFTVSAAATETETLATETLATETLATETVAATASPLLTTTPVASAGKVFFFLLVVVGMILLLAWLVNKTRAGQLAGAGRNLKMIAVMPVGTREKVAVIQAGSQQLVIGITPQQITTLAELKEPLTTDTERPADFSEILKLAVRK